MDPQTLVIRDNQIINEESQDNQHGDVIYPEDAPVTFEFLEESPITAYDLETDSFLGLHEDEPDSWSPTVGKEISKKLKEKEVKRQEHIYEFILTEKHHCLTLRVMQKIFVEGLQKYFNLGPDVERMFPKMQELTDIHLKFLHRLRERQKAAPVVDTISDILLEQFSGLHAQKLKAAYGEFCSRHRDAVELYKCYLQDRKFAEFVRHCQQNPLLKKKGIPECILFVTQRLTKYPLLIEPLIKSSKDNKPEQERYQRALALVKEILVAVDAQVAEKEKEDRKLEIYNRIDAKSFTSYRGTKFKKSDILSDNRRLRFEGIASLMQGRSKMQLVLVIVLSDVLFFLQDNNHKYSFFTPDNKTGVVSLQKLLVREKAGQESRGIYLISSNPSEPEMFELKVHKPKDKQVWIQAIRNAVKNCPEEEDVEEALSAEGRQKLFEAKQNHIRQIVEILRQKDHEQALILEEKMALQLKLLAASGLTNVPEPPSYCHLVTEDADTNTMWKKVISAVQEVSQLASSLYASGTNLSRSVSSVGEHHSETYVSPTLPKRAETFGGFDNSQVPGSKLGVVLKKHAPNRDSPSSPCGGEVPVTPDTDKSNKDVPRIPLDRMSWRDAMMSAIPPDVMGTNTNQAPGDLPALLTLGREQQLAAVQLSHYVYTLLCIIWQQMTSIDSLQAQLAALKTQITTGDRDKKPMYRHNHQLEELRNLQDRLTQEKETWQREKEAEEKELDEKREEVRKLQEQIKCEQNDITQQREQLFRKLEMLTSQGILISPNMPVVNTPPHDEDHILSEIDLRKKIDTQKWKPPSQGKTPSLPLNLISATNQQKVHQSVHIKQQLPLKLANKLGGSQAPSSSSSASGVQQMLPLKLSQTNEPRRSSSGVGAYQRLGSGSSPPEMSHSHTRTGSSPAMMQNSPTGEQASPSSAGSPNKVGRTHTYPKHPDRMRIRSPEAEPPKTPPSASSDEKVIFF